MAEKEWLGWHFLPKDKRLRYGTKEIVEVGRPITIKGSLELCVWGLHASSRALDALPYAPYNTKYACRVRLSGTILDGGDKSVASTRQVLWVVDATKTLHLFACLVAEEAFAKYGNGDKRSLAAIRAKRDWLEGRIDREKLLAARAAAEAAAEDATGQAAREAAWA